MTTTDPALIADPSWRRVDATTLLAGSPLRLFRVTTAGGAVLDALEHGATLPAAHRALTDRLLAAGAIHPAPAPGAGPWRIADVTVVVPTFGEPAASVAATAARLAPIATVIVDDGSRRPLDPEPFGPTTRVIRLDRNGGPAAARNAGLAAVDTPFVLFLDADAAIDRADVERLLGHMADERVAAVAPRIVPPPGGAAGARAAYEGVRSPLDMGPDPALVRAGTRVSYVPAAVLLCRTATLRRIGGFATALRYGEDVDLVWRLTSHGSAVRYEPAAVATHAIRPTLGALLRQRYHYGTAAGVLAQRHPGALAPVRVSPWGGAGWAAIAAGHPIVGTVTALAGGARLARALAPAGGAGWRAASSVAATAAVHGGRQLADAATSVWWPLSVLAALTSRRARRAVVAAAAVPAAVEWIQRRPHLDPVTFGALRALDRAAYGLGVLRGALDRREPGPLMPAIV